MELFDLALAGKLEEALPLYRRLLPLFRYDASPQMVQSIKYMMELTGFPVGPTRAPRLLLLEADYEAIRQAYQYVISGK